MKKKAVFALAIAVFGSASLGAESRKVVPRNVFGAASLKMNAAKTCSVSEVVGVEQLGLENPFPMGIAVDSGGTVSFSDYENESVYAARPDAAGGKANGGEKITPFYVGNFDTAPVSIGIANGAAGYLYMTGLIFDRTPLPGGGYHIKGGYEILKWGASAVGAVVAKGVPILARDVKEFDTTDASVHNIPAAVDLVADKSGDLFVSVCDVRYEAPSHESSSLPLHVPCRILKIDSSGNTSTIVSDGTTSAAGGIVARSIGLDLGGGLALDPDGNLYIAEFFGDRVRKVDTDGVMTTVAGTGVTGYSGDGGPAVDAALSGPSDVAADGYGNVFIADTGNGLIRKIDKNGRISTIAGGGTRAVEDGRLPPLDAILARPMGLALDDDGNLFLTDAEDSAALKRISSVSLCPESRILKQPLRPAETIWRALPGPMKEIQNLYRRSRVPSLSPGTD
ncbi:MAG TPA: hypothetical protein VLJ37_08870 [bacterium]|nr:hypothetical protein [bacterium]